MSQIAHAVEAICGSDCRQSAYTQIAAGIIVGCPIDQYQHLLWWWSRNVIQVSHSHPPAPPVMNVFLDPTKLFVLCFCVFRHFCGIFFLEATGTLTGLGSLTNTQRISGNGWMALHWSEGRFTSFTTSLPTILQRCLIAEVSRPTWHTVQLSGLHLVHSFQDKKNST